MSEADLHGAAWRRSTCSRLLARSHIVRRSQPHRASSLVRVKYWACRRAGGKRSQQRGPEHGVCRAECGTRGAAACHAPYEWECSVGLETRGRRPRPASAQSPWKTEEAGVLDRSRTRAGVVAVLEDVGVSGSVPRVRFAGGGRSAGCPSAAGIGAPFDLKLGPESAAGSDTGHPSSASNQSQRASPQPARRTHDLP